MSETMIGHLRWKGDQQGDSVLKEAADEIERLRQQLREAQDPAADGPLQSEIATLQECIEELEAAEERWAFKHGVCKGLHHITTDQIDSAWRHANTHVEVESRLVEFALNELGIVRCGCPKLSVGIRGYIGGPCPDCNGHGWRIIEGGESDSNA